jgi:hypothetical protein
MVAVVVMEGEENKLKNDSLPIERGKLLLIRVITVNLDFGAPQ